MYAAHLISRFLTAGSSRIDQNRSHRRRAVVESLEGRQLLAGGIKFDYATRAVKMEGTSSADYAEAWYDAGKPFSVEDDRFVISLTGGGATQTIRLARSQTPTQITFEAREGNDRFMNYTSIRLVAYGGSGDDHLQGGSASDWLEGGAGDDFLQGGSADDSLYGGGGNDLIYGDAGNDLVQAGLGDDLVYGGAGRDILYGEAGNDHLYGQSGPDILDGGAGNDLIHGGDDGYVDELWGGTGADTFYRETYRPWWWLGFVVKDRDIIFDARIIEGDVVL